MKDGQWFYYDGQLKPPHTQPLTAKIIQRSVTQHVLFVRQNKEQSTAVLQDKLERAFNSFCMLYISPINVFSFI